MRIPREYEENNIDGERVLIDSKGHITHRDNPGAEDILSSYNVSLREDARKLASTIVAWKDAKTWSQGQ